jgi:hypothetical protein
MTRDSTKRYEVPLGWCAERDLNPHGFRHTPLKRTCLPIPPPAHGWADSTRKTRACQLSLSKASSFRSQGLKLDPESQEVREPAEIDVLVAAL